MCGDLISLHPLSFLPSDYRLGPVLIGYALNLVTTGLIFGLALLYVSYIFELDLADQVSILALFGTSKSSFPLKLS